MSNSASRPRALSTAALAVHAALCLVAIAAAAFATRTLAGTALLLGPV